MIRNLLLSAMIDFKVVRFLLSIIFVFNCYLKQIYKYFLIPPKLFYFFTWQNLQNYFCLWCGTMPSPGFQDWQRTKIKKPQREIGGVLNWKGGIELKGYWIVKPPYWIVKLINDVHSFRNWPHQQILTSITQGIYSVIPIITRHRASHLPGVVIELFY